MYKTNTSNLFSKTAPRRPECCDIWTCNLPGGGGSIQEGYRPVFILSNNQNNTYSPTINVIPLTSKMHKRLPIHVELWNYHKYGLRKPSTLLVEQITTVSADSLDRHIGVVDDAEVLENVWSAIRLQFPILQKVGSRKVANIH